MSYRKTFLHFSFAKDCFIESSKKKKNLVSVKKLDFLLNSSLFVRNFKAHIKQVNESRLQRDCAQVSY